MSNEISDLTVLETSGALKGRTIGLCVCGGIAGILAPQAVRELRRFGATVKCIVTQKALSFVGETALEWASAQPIEKDFKGHAPHICVNDALVVMPATANTLIKAHLGLCDDVVSTLIQSALGQGKKVLFFPSMHASLAHSPALKDALEALEKLENVHVFWGGQEEGKLKTLDPKTIALISSHFINASLMPNRSRVLLTTGGTYSAIDKVRIVTNKSSGRLGYLTALELYRWGHKITVLEGTTAHHIPPLQDLSVDSCPEFDDMRTKFEIEIDKHPTALIHMAAVSDFKIVNTFSGKYSSQTVPPQLEWVKAEKLINFPNCQNIKFKLCCKLTQEIGEEGADIARRFLKEKKLNAIIWNSIEDAFGKKNHEAKIFSEKEDSTHIGKEDIARRIIAILEDNLK